MINPFFQKVDPRFLGISCADHTVPYGTIFRGMNSQALRKLLAIRCRKIGHIRMARRYGYLGWFFVPEGHLIVARRFIAGSGTKWGLRPGGTTEYRRAMYRPWAKPNFDRPGRDQILKTNTGDKSPAYFQVVPPGHQHRHDKVSVVSVFQNLASIDRGSAVL